MSEFWFSSSRRILKDTDSYSFLLPSSDFSPATLSLPSFLLLLARGLCENLARCCQASQTPSQPSCSSAGHPRALSPSVPPPLPSTCHSISPDFCDGYSPRTVFPPSPSLGLCVVSCVTSRVVAIHYHCPESSPTPGQTVGSPRAWALTPFTRNKQVAG